MKVEARELLKIARELTGGGVKRWLEDISVEMGLDGEITKAVMKEGEKRMKKVRVRPDRKKKAARELTADMFFDPTPDWDRVKFNEPKNWVWQWNGGGWNGVVAKSKREAIGEAKKKFKDSPEWLEKIDERTFRVPTEREYKALLRMFD